MQSYFINSYAQLALAQAISEEEVECDGDGVCITDAVTDKMPFSLNVFLWTTEYTITVLTFTEGISI